MDDLIRRQDAIDAIQAINSEGDSGINSVLGIIELKIIGLSSAEPKRGKWERKYSRRNVYADLAWHCSACGYASMNNWADKMNFCPNCGADMRNADV